MARSGTAAIRFQSGDSLSRIDPLQDPRWVKFLDSHPDASVFHFPGWLNALRKTYGYEPQVFTTAAETSDLTDGIVFCKVDSWLTGSRLVSVPFADHCQPLLSHSNQLETLLPLLRSCYDRDHCRYFELRPLILSSGLSRDTGLSRSESFYYHSLDLRPEPDL